MEKTEILGEKPTLGASASKFDRVCAILDKYACDSTRLVPILQDIQHEYSYLPEDIMTYVATALGVSASAVYGVATFYSHFTLKPKGKFLVKLCDGTACHVKKSEAILQALRKELDLSGKKNTTDDFLFTLETVACLGACGLAPVVVVNEKVHGQMTPESAVALIDEIRAKEKAGN